MRFAGRDPLRDVTAYRSTEPANTAANEPGRFDLSSNELVLPPLPPLPTVLSVIEDGLSRLARYPDPTARTITEEIAKHLHVSPDAVAVGPGSAGVLQQILLALCGVGDEVIYAWPGFDAYPLLVAISGATSVHVPLTSTGDHDLDEIRARVGPRTRVILLCSPHNPTGVVIDRHRLDSFLRSLPGDVLTVLDEAYVEFDRGENPPGTPDVLSRHRNIVVLRTFSKAYGLAGLRIGYAAGPERIMVTVRKAGLPFGVTHIAEQAAILSLHSEGELRGRLDTVTVSRDELTAGLRWSGLPVLPSRANFVWLPLAAAADSFAQDLAEAGIRVRPYPGYGVRISVGAPEAQESLLRSLGRGVPTIWV
nr:histidinol-phosphate transaminase [Frankia sp. CeD]